MLARILIAAAILLAPSTALAQWKRAETRHFVIYSDSSNDRIEKLAERLESYDKLMRMATGIAEDVKPVKVRIYEVAGTADIDRALGYSRSGIAGFYSSNPLGPFLVTPRRFDFETRGDVTPELVLQHEYAHHFMLQYFPAIYPSWYVEGFAELIGSSKMLGDGRIGYGMPAKHRGDEIAAYWVPLQELLTRERVRDLDTYGQGWALAHFFTFNTERGKQFRAYLAALGNGHSFEQAAQVFGNLGELNREARRYVTSGTFSYTPVRPEIRRPVIENIRTLPAAEAELVPMVIAFSDIDLESIRKEHWRDRLRRVQESNLKQIREVAGKYPNDPFALYFLAEAETASGNVQPAEIAVDRLLAIEPNNVRAMARKSILLSRQARVLRGAERAAATARARELAVRANRADVDDPMPLLAYYQSFHLTGEKVPAEAIDGLMQVVSTVPGDTVARRLLVNQLESDGRYVEAIGWLIALANSPHDTPLRDAAREQLERLRAKLGIKQAA
ncbi:MAG TPA: hypothetical protein VM346_09770 [Sphingomicrobium sp.]|nr:hypothetical protein [Sphingomicrobium sp.]